MQEIDILLSRMCFYSFYIEDREKRSSEQLINYAHLSALFLDFSQREIVTTPQEVIDYLCKVRKSSSATQEQFSCNNFNISDEEMKYIGIGLYPILALINHSYIFNLKVE
jgi:hypothetical protein